MKSSTLVVLALLTFPIGMGVIALEGRTAAKSIRAAFASGTGDVALKEPTAGFRVAGLMVNSPVHTGADPASDDTFGVELAFFGTFARTSVAVEYAFDKGGIIGIDDKASSLTRFVDDKGTDLVEKDTFNGPFEMMSRVSEDGRHLVFVIPSDRLPKHGATRISAAGALGLQIATETVDFVAEGIVLQEGEGISLGGFDLMIEGAGAAEWGDGQSVTFSSKRDLGDIVSFAFVLADGSEVPLTRTMSMGGMGSWQQTLNYEGDFEEASLRITCWKDLKKVAVPFEIEAGLGLRSR